ncbi:hypothetical protein TNCV_3544481 [Trichonephila clavipes]|nr:hypothetical protein TNCV_3544481 [Trichonephila clavipes]
MKITHFKVLWIDADKTLSLSVAFPVYRIVPVRGSKVSVGVGKRERNRDYTGMWVRLGSTDLMAGKVMFLRSNQGDRLDGNESVADSFRSDLVGFKSRSGRFLGAFFLPLMSARKNLQSGSELATRGHPFRHSYSQQISTTLIVHCPPLPKMKERFITKLPFNFSLDVKSMKISSSKVESPSEVS